MWGHNGAQRQPSGTDGIIDLSEKKALSTLPRTNMEVENHLFVVESGLPMGYSPLPC